jgi:hypothetical protein
MHEVAEKMKLKIKTTTDINDLPACGHMLVYLTGDTWTGGARSDDFAKEVKEAMDGKVQLLLAHEMPGMPGDGQEARRGVEFSTFFACPNGATPADLLQAGIYAQIAVALKGGAWREASMVMMAEAIGNGMEAESPGASVLAQLRQLLPARPAVGRLAHAVFGTRTALGRRPSQQETEAPQTEQSEPSEDSQATLQHAISITARPVAPLASVRRPTTMGLGSAAAALAGAKRWKMAKTPNKTPDPFPTECRKPPANAALQRPAAALMAPVEVVSAPDEESTQRRNRRVRKTPSDLQQVAIPLSVAEAQTSLDVAVADREGLEQQLAVARCLSTVSTRSVEPSSGGIMTEPCENEIVDSSSSGCAGAATVDHAPGTSDAHAGMTPGSHLNRAESSSSSNKIAEESTTVAIRVGNGKSPLLVPSQPPYHPTCSSNSIAEETTTVAFRVGNGKSPQPAPTQPPYHPTTLPVPSVEYGRECSICMVNPVCMVMKPCNHCCACDQCAARLVLHPCPICRCHVEDTERIYF